MGWNRLVLDSVDEIQLEFEILPLSSIWLCPFAQNFAAFPLSPTSNGSVGMSAKMVNPSKIEFLLCWSALWNLRNCFYFEFR